MSDAGPKDARVTCADREAATTALRLGVSDALFAFEFAGATCGEDALEEAAALAQVIANTRRDTRAAIFARLRALLDRSGDHVLALDLRLLIAEMEAGHGV